MADAESQQEGAQTPADDAADPNALPPPGFVWETIYNAMSGIVERCLVPVEVFKSPPEPAKDGAERKKRGRPPKQSQQATAAADDAADGSAVAKAPTAEKKRRGRTPRQAQVDQAAADDDGAGAAAAATHDSVKRRATKRRSTKRKLAPPGSKKLGDDDVCGTALGEWAVSVVPWKVVHDVLRSVQLQSL